MTDSDTLTADQRKRTTRRGRRLFTPSVFVMTGVWLALWGDFAPFGIISGLVVAWLIRWRFPMPPMYWPGSFHPWGGVKLVAGLIFDLVVSSWRIVKLALAPGVNLRPGIVRVDLVTDVDMYQVQVAEMISLVPGTVVVELVRSPRRLYLHVIDMDEDHDAPAIREMAVRIERNVLAAFGSKEERVTFEAQHTRPQRRRRSPFSNRWETEE